MDGESPVGAPPRLPQPLHWRVELLSKRISRRGLYGFLEQQFAALPAGGRVLTIGAGGPINARLAAHAARRGLRVTSVDIDPARGPDVVADVCARDFAPGRFDAAVMAEVLEHMHAPRRALANVHAALEPDGRLILTVPFVFGLHNRPRDYFRPTRYGLELLLSDFRDVVVAERNSWAEAVLVLLVRHHREPARRSLALALPLLALAVVLMPVARALGRLAPSDTLTTGYVVSARR